MEEDHAVEFVSLHDGPASALGWVHFIVPAPGPFNRWFAVPCRQVAIHLAVNVAEVKLTLVLASELEIAPPPSSSSTKS